MNDEDQAVRRLLNGISESEDGWPYRDSSDAENRPSAFAPELVSLKYIRAAVRRGAPFWCALAVIGLLLGLGYKAKYPTPYQASTTVLLPQDALSDGSILNDAAVAQSRAVAGLAVQKLHLSEAPESFAKSYTVTAPTSEVLVIATTAPSIAGAVKEANEVAAAFLTFRDGLELAEQKTTVSSLTPLADQARHQVQSLNTQISSLSQSASDRAELVALQSKEGQASNALSSDNAEIRTAQQQATLQIRDSKVLDAGAQVPTSRKKPILVAAAIGLFAGLILGIGILAIRAVVSDRLRQRDDVAHALGAPVSLSVGRIRRRWWALRRPEFGAPRSVHVKRMVTHLRRELPRSSDRPVELAIVAVDDSKATAISVASLAVQSAREGGRVVLADLAAGRPAARLFGVSKPGVIAVGQRGARLAVFVPEREDFMPVGPRRGSGEVAGSAPAEELIEICAQADLLLVLATLDPALGGEHLATWAPDAVAVVTAGRSSWAKIHSVGEMLRMADVRLSSAVLVGADKSDESVGLLDPKKSSQQSNVPRQVAADPSVG